MLCGFLFILCWLAVTKGTTDNDRTGFSAAGLKPPSAFSVCLFLLFILFSYREAVATVSKGKQSNSLFDLVVQKKPPHTRESPLCWLSAQRHWRFQRSCALQEKSACVCFYVCVCVCKKRAEVREITVPLDNNLLVLVIAKYVIEILPCWGRCCCETSKSLRISQSTWITRALSPQVKSCIIFYSCDQITQNE